MTHDEVNAMTDKELRATAWELIGGCWGEDAPDYPNDIAAAWPLIEHARREPVLFESFCESIDETVSNDAWGLLESLDARAITRAFIMAMTQEDK